MYALITSLRLLATDLVARTAARARQDRGQSTAEYALVLLGAAAVALLVTSWAVRTNRVGRLLDAVMDQLLDRVK